MPDPGRHVERLPRIVERHRLLHGAVVEMDPAGPVHGDEQQLRFAMGVPAAPLAGCNAVQPEKAPRLEIEALAELQEIDLAAGIGGAGHGDPVTIAGFESVGHAAMGVRSLRTCMYTTPLKATKPPTIW